MTITAKISVSSVIITLLLFASSEGCIKEEFNPANFDASIDLQSGLAIPVGFSHMAFEEYLTDTVVGEELRIGKDGFLSLFYSTPVDSGVMGDLLTLSNTSVDRQLVNETSSIIFLSIPGSSAVILDSLSIPIATDQVVAGIDSIKMLSGSVQLAVNSTGLTGTVTFLINGLKVNGVPFSATRDLSDPDLSVSLAGSTIIPELDLTGNNVLKCFIRIDLQTPSGPVNPGGTILDLNANLLNMSYETIYGDFSGYVLDFPARIIPTPFFNKFTGGQIIFADPRISLLFSNSAGVPFGIYFRRIDAIDMYNNALPLTGPGVPVETSPKVIGYPSLSQAGETITDSLVIDATNSNLPVFIASYPDSIVIGASASIVQPSTPETTFIRYDSRYSVAAEIRIPLWGRADFNILLDTLEFNYLSSALPPPDEIERLIVRTVITNSFPVTAFPQIYFLNESRVLLDSLFSGVEKIEGAIDKDGDGKADPFKQAPIDIDLQRSKMDNLLNTRFIIVKGRIMTTDFPAIDVRLYSQYFLEYNVGLIAQLKLKTGK